MQLTSGQFLLRIIIRETNGFPHFWSVTIIDHKFMISDHSRMECDSDHALIKKAKKKKKVCPQHLDPPQLGSTHRVGRNEAPIQGKRAQSNRNSQFRRHLQVQHEHKTKRVQILRS